MAKEQLGIYKEAIKNFLGPVWPLMEDDKVSEILINGPDEIFIEVGGVLKKSEARFETEDDLRAAVNNIAQSVNRRIDDENPRLDARLPDGSRIAAVIPPCSLNGTVVSIRKFTQTQVSFRDYIKLGSLTQQGAQFLDVCMFLGKNILVSGGTGSGKTTLLGLLCSRIPKGQRIIVIEDSAELQINYEHIVKFETRMADELGKGEVNIRDLVKSSLRLRPDRIIVGEVRSAEALDLLNAMNTGHKGCLGTVHANTPEDAIVRLEALAQGGDSRISEKALRYQVVSGIDMIVQISRCSDGSRKITAISEVLGFNEDGSYNVEHLFTIPNLVRMADGQLKGELEPTGHLPSFMEEIEDNRLPFSKDEFRSQTSKIPKAS